MKQCATVHLSRAILASQLFFLLMSSTMLYNVIKYAIMKTDIVCRFPHH